MKVLVVLVFFVAACYAFDDKCQGKYMLNVIQTCAAEKGAAQSDIDDLRYARGAGNDAAKNFRACLFEKCKYFDNGKFVESTPIRHAWLLHGGNESKVPDIEKAGKGCLGTPVTGNLSNDVDKYITCLVSSCPTCGLAFVKVFD